MEEFGTKLLEFAKAQKMLLEAFIIGLLFIGFGVFQLTVRPTDDIVIQRHADSPSASSSASTDSEATVDVEGGVSKPGVYTMPSDSRIQDAVMKAGGFSSNANQDLVSRQVNLATKVVDGTKVYIPTMSDPVGAGQTASSDTSVVGAATSVININSASAQDLDSLPGVGQITAQKIITNRPYGSTNDLVTKKVVTQKVFDKLKDLISTY